MKKSHLQWVEGDRIGNVKEITKRRRKRKSQSLRRMSQTQRHRDITCD